MAGAFCRRLLLLWIFSLHGTSPGHNESDWGVYIGGGEWRVNEELTDALTSGKTIPPDISFWNQRGSTFIWANVFVSFLAGPS